MIDREIDRPTPSPCGLVVVNGLNNLDLTASAKPHPVDNRVTRLEERLNALHNYIRAPPVRLSPYGPPDPSRRGDLLLELPFDKGMN